MQFVNNSSQKLPDSTLQTAITLGNKIYSAAGISFTIKANHEVISDKLAIIDDTESLTEAEWAKANAPFNPNCDMGHVDFANMVEHEQMWRVAARCALSGEILIYVRQNPGTQSAGGGKLVVTSRTGIADRTEMNGLLWHEIGHYLGLPHVWDQPYHPTAYPDHVTGQAVLNSRFWDLVYGPGLAVYDSEAAAASNEKNLRPIQADGGSGWFCPNNFGRPCPSGNFLSGTIGMPVGGGSTIWHSGHKGLKGLSLPWSEGVGYTTNLMSYAYTPEDNPARLRTQALSASQIAHVQQTLEGPDIPLEMLSASGQIIWSGRPRLGLTASTRSLMTVDTFGHAKLSPGTLATNGADSWVVSPETYNADGNRVYWWDIQTRTWIPKNVGAAQLAVPSDGGLDAPWLITNSGTVKRVVNGVAQEPPKSSGSCAVSLAVGPSSAPYVWAVGCAPSTANGNKQIYRYTEGSGWVATSGWAAQVVVDGKGSPWARNVEGELYRGNLDASGMPATWTRYNLPSGVLPVQLSAGAYRNTDLPPTVLANNGRTYTWRPTGTAWRATWTPAASPAYIAGALPFLWVVAPSTGRISYVR